MRLEITGFGHKRLVRTIHGVRDRAENLRPAFMAAYERFRELEQIQFGTQGRGRWKELEGETIDRKKKLGLDTRILHATLVLRNSLTKRGARYASFRMQGQDGATFGSRDPKGKYHQDAKRLPVRKPIDLHDQDRRELVDIVRDYVMGDLA